MLKITRTTPCPITFQKFNPANYEKVATGGTVDFYWRLVNDDAEVEGVIVGRNTRSYVAVGWRPSGTPSSCKKFPDDLHNGRGRIHPMDCMDVIVGAVHSDSSSYRVGDYYTRDRSTPQPDSFYGGASDLTAAFGWYENGATHIMFRKRASKADGTKAYGDHDFAGTMDFIWAHGR